MHFENNGITVWIDAIDASEITVAVQPIDADNRVELLMQRRGHASVERVPAKWLWHDYIDGIQYFQGTISGLSPGDQYLAVCSCGGRQVPEPIEQEHAWATFESGLSGDQFPTGEVKGMGRDVAFRDASAWSSGGDLERTKWVCRDTKTNATAMVPMHAQDFQVGFAANLVRGLNLDWSPQSGFLNSICRFLII